MNELLTTQSLEGTPLTISATSMPSLDGMGTGAIRSSVFEINNSSSNVNFIAHVWACCSDLLLAEEAYGPKGRQGKGSEDPLLIKLSSSAGILHLQCNRRYSSLNSTRREDLSKSAFFVATSLRAASTQCLSSGSYCPCTLQDNITQVVKPKQVSVIDADPCNEVRSRGVSLTNRIRHIMSQPSSRLNAQ